MCLFVELICLGWQADLTQLLTHYKVRQYFTNYLPYATETLCFYLQPFYSNLSKPDAALFEGLQRNVATVKGTIL